MNFDEVVNWIWAAAGLGTAAFGFIEALKWTPLGLIGLGRVMSALGEDGMAALGSVYGTNNVKALLGGTFRKGTTDLATLLKNGLRVALTDPTNAARLAASFGQDPQELASAVARLRTSAASYEQPHGVRDDPERPAPFLDARATLGKFELALDARIDAAIAAADDTYSGAMRTSASIAAIAASVFVAWTLDMTHDHGLLKALALGIAAVPIAPIAKDLVSLLNSARDALKGRAATK